MCEVYAEGLEKKLTAFSRQQTAWEQHLVISALKKLLILSMIEFLIAIFGSFFLWFLLRNNSPLRHIFNWHNQADC
jgi:hypothetical protein